MASVNDVIKYIIPRGSNARRIQITELIGGLTNKNYRIDIDGVSYVASIDGGGTKWLDIDRDSELHNARKAFQYGIGPKVILRLPNILVQGFVHGKVLRPGDLKSPKRLQSVVDVLRRCHRIPITQVRGFFSVFRSVERHLATSRPFKPPFPDNLNWIAKQTHRIEEALKQQPSVPAFCHNDTVPENMIATGDQLILIDWEYAGVGDRYFDLGMLAAYHDLDDVQEEALLETYFGTCNEGSIARLKLMRAMSDLRDASWAMVQSAVSSLGFNYVSYGLQRFKRFTATCSTSEFERFLVAAATTSRLARSVKMEELRRC